MADQHLQVVWRNAEHARASMAALVSPFCKAQFANGHAVEIEIRLHEDAKTDRQRGYYHGVVLKTISRHQMPDGTQYDLRTWKEFFRERFLGHKTVTFKNPITGKKHRRRQRISTEDIGVKKYADLIERVIAYASIELGVIVPIPYTQWEAMQVDMETGEIIGGFVE